MPSEIDLDYEEAHMYPVRAREYSPAADALRRALRELPQPQHLPDPDDDEGPGYCRSCGRTATQCPCVGGPLR